MIESKSLCDIAENVLYHHERWDGKGYPEGLTRDNTPLISRIIAVADAYDAMTSDRPYREALDEDTATQEIITNAGSQLDPFIAQIFVEKVLGRAWI